ncbi:MAG: DUF3782 domain-containing protein [Desulfonauticus sp.]|nr:DUF3782 domain-containing protein [Desulfonauticus sp.]
MIIQTKDLDTKVKRIIYDELPGIIDAHPEVRYVLWKILVNSFANKQETESKFDKMLAELQDMKRESNRKWRELKEDSERKWAESDRKWKELKEESEKKWRELKEESDKKWRELKEESDRKWRELKEESDKRWDYALKKWEESDRKWRELKEESDKRWDYALKKWEESDRKWRELKEESDKKWQQTLDEIKRVDRRIDKTIGALGARWGLNSEKAFRNAIRDILSELTGMKVERYLSYDEAGEVFGHPDQVELDVVIKNGKLYIIEIKSSVSKADMYIFDRKVRFYEQKEGKKVDKKIVISPMIENKAYEVASKLGIEAYVDPEDVKIIGD